MAENHRPSRGRPSDTGAMSSAMLSRWPVLLTITIEAGDVDDEDRTQLSEVGIERLLTVARAAFGEQCRTFDWSATEVAETTVLRGRGPAVGLTGAVAVSVDA